MLRTALALLALSLVLPIAPAAAQGVPTLTLGSSASVHLIPPGEIKADGKRISLLVLVTDESGALASGVRFRGSAASTGRLDQDCPQVGPGLYSCGYVTPDRYVSGATVNLKARLPSNANVEASYPIDVVPSGRARIAFNANPAEVVLTQDPSSAITFTVTDDNGAPLDGLDLRAAANVGQVQAVAAAGGGNYSAVYVPPSTPFPQVALISVWDANDPERVFGFFRINLVGKVDYPVDARAPGVTLIFTVGENTFPPVVSDATGRASVPIMVPPGVRYAQVELIQPTGARSTQQIDLQVPAFNRLVLGGAPVFLPSDGQSTALIRIFAVDGKGRPADGQNLSLSTSQGKISQAKFLGNGLYEAEYMAPWLDAAGTATISAALVGEEASSNDSIDLGLEPAPAIAISLVADPAQVTPDDSKVTLTARLVDDKGQPARGKQGVEFRTAEGPLTSVKSLGKAAFSAEMPVTWNVRSRAQVIAAVRGNRQAVRQLIALPMSDWVMTGQKVPVTVLSLDAYGNPVADVAVNVSVSGGGGQVTSSVQTDARGLGTVVYTAGQLSGLATLQFTAGDAKYVAPVWQSPEPLKSFEFPVSGGQRQGRTLAKWRKLRATVDLGQTPEPVATTAEPVAGGGGVWGSGGGEATPVGSDSGSVGAAGNATAIKVSTLPSQVPVTGGTVSVIVRVVDANGILVPATNVLILADGGQISGKTDNGDGTFSATLTVPPDVGKNSITITAATADDQAGVGHVQVGDALAAGTGTGAGTTKPKKPKKPMAAAPAGDRGKHRMARVHIGWTPGLYTYDSNPCVDGSDPCEAPADSALDDYDFLKVEIRGAEGSGPMPAVGSFALGGEVYPLNDHKGLLSVGVRGGFARMAYSTNFEANSGSGDSHCDTHFCDGMTFLNVQGQVRFALLNDKGPLDIIVRPIGYQFQDVVIFRRLYSEDTQAREPRFETIGLHTLQFGFGVQYTIIPMIRPHVDYNLSAGLGATLGEANFPVPGVTNHNVQLGVTVLPVMGLLLDVSYDLTTRSLGLAFQNEEGVTQRGALREQAHTFRLSAGWAF